MEKLWFNKLILAVYWPKSRIDIVVLENVMKEANASAKLEYVSTTKKYCSHVIFKKVGKSIARNKRETH